jgi:hypothetical protein
MGVGGQGSPDACPIHVSHKAISEPAVCDDSSDIGEEILAADREPDPVGEESSDARGDIR